MRWESFRHYVLLLNGLKISERNLHVWAWGLSCVLPFEIFHLGREIGDAPELLELYFISYLLSTKNQVSTLNGNSVWLRNCLSSHLVLHRHLGYLHVMASFGGSTGTTKIHKHTHTHTATTTNTKNKNLWNSYLNKSLKIM